MNPELKQIIEEAQKGSEAAFTELYNHTCDFAYYRACRYLNNQDDVKDVLQESYISAFRNIKTFDTSKDFRPWLMVIVRNNCINLSKKRTDVPVDVDTMEEVADDDSFLPAEYLEREDKRKEIISIIDNLPTAQRTATVLYYFEELSVAEISELTGVSESTVKTNLYHARKKIKALVLEEEKKGNKLYGVFALPVLRQIIEAEADTCTIPQAMSEAVLSNTVSSLPGAASAGAGATPSIGARFSALSAPVKVAAVAITGAVVIGAVVLGIVLAGGGDDGAYVSEPEDAGISAVEVSELEELETEISEPEQSTPAPDESELEESEGEAGDDESQPEEPEESSAAEVPVPASQEPQVKQAPAAQTASYSRIIVDSATCPDLVLYDGVQIGNTMSSPFARTDYFMGGSFSDTSLTASDYFSRIPQEYWVQQPTMSYTLDSLDHVLGFFRQEYQGTAYSGYQEIAEGQGAYTITCQKGSLYIWARVYTGTVNIGGNSQSGVYIDMEASQIPHGTVYTMEGIERGERILYSN